MSIDTHCVCDCHRERILVKAGRKDFVWCGVPTLLAFVSAHTHLDRCRQMECRIRFVDDCGPDWDEVSSYKEFKPPGSTTSMSDAERESIGDGRFVSSPPKGETCDVCKRKGPIRWWGNTSVAVCSRAECSETMSARWQESMREMQKETDDEYYGRQPHQIDE